MSSATTHAALTPATGTSTTSRQYTPSARDPYYSQQPTSPSLFPGSAGRQSKRPASSSVPSSPNNVQYQPSGESAASNVAAARTQYLSSSPMGSPLTSSPYRSTLSPSPGGAPATLPARTSSYPQEQTITAETGYQPGSSRSPDYRRSPSNSTRLYGEIDSPYGHEMAEERMRDDTATAAAAAARERRRGAHPTSPANTPRSIDARDARARRSPNVLPREDSTVLNRVLITDPQVDIAREQARMAESRPGGVGADLSPITSLGPGASPSTRDQEQAGSRSRQDYSRSDKSRRETKFGEYLLGQTIGEGEFGKVKLGWKRTGGVQVAIKLIRREVLGSNPSRLPKIYREIAILRELAHPNIVRLHEMVETERHIGIIMEYASGGELFDYILNHRYLKDNAARRLFAQLVSGVGYLHKKGIVHRDLKLENLLLDRNKNIIITDFGFANTFNPLDELGDEIEYNLSNRDFIKKTGLNVVLPDGHRRGDLMQTSCGSPCYAAPELVVSDSLYTGRKVDVWSCGVILYAMLAGYLPFDDDPANPEGDNINLLYRYITSTPLTFPEYVTPHARDLLRRILVPDPRKRADLFEVARHSWLSEYAHVVGFITSSTTTTNDIANSTVMNDEQNDVPTLARSASVREPTKASRSSPADFVNKLAQNEQSGKRRDAKRRTLQVEYVAPQSQTSRGQSVLDSKASPTARTAASANPKRASGGKRNSREIAAQVLSAPLQDNQDARPQSRSNQGVPTASRATKDVPRSVSDTAAFGMQSTSVASTRPNTGAAGSGVARLPSRGNSYGQPSAATVAQTNAQGRFSQPKIGRQSYVISDPIPQDAAVPEEPAGKRPSTQQGFVNQEPAEAVVSQDEPQKGHKRYNSVGGIFGRSVPLFSGRTGSEQRPQKADKRYPPVSMPSNVPANNQARISTDSRRPSSAFGRKSSDGAREEKSSKRFSLLPSSWSRGSSGRSRDQSAKDAQRPGSRRDSAQQTPGLRPMSRGTGMAFGRGQSRSPSQSTTGSTIQVTYDSNRDRTRGSVTQQTMSAQVGAAAAQTQPSAAYGSPATGTRDAQRRSMQPHPQAQEQSTYPRPEPHTSLPQQRRPPSSASRPLSTSYEPHPNPPPSRAGNERTSGLQVKNRKFADAYESNKHGQMGGQHAGSSGSVKKVMDYFRRRGKARGG